MNISNTINSQLDNYQAIPDNELADIYDGAADYIETHGWTRFTTINTLGQVCMAGAVGAVISEPMVKGEIEARWDTHIYSRWLTATRRLAGFIPGGEAVSAWNDDEATDKFEVIDKLRDAAKTLRNGDSPTAG